MGIFEDAQKLRHVQAMEKAKLDAARSHHDSVETKRLDALTRKQKTEIKEFIEAAQRLNVRPNSYKTYTWVWKGGPDRRNESTHKSVSGWSIRSYQGLSYQTDVDTNKDRTYHMVVSTDGEIYSTENQKQKWRISPLQLPFEDDSVGNLLRDAVVKMINKTYSG